jgi:hypothetical protein
MNGYFLEPCLKLPIVGLMNPVASESSTLLALAGIEDCIDRYIGERRSRVDAFVERHFSLPDTFALQKRSLITNLVCYPVNSLWSIPYLFVKKLGESLEKLGWGSAAGLVSAVPSGLKSLYQKDVELMVRMEIMGSEHELMEILRQDPRVAPLLGEPEFERQFDMTFTDISRLIESYGSSRALVADTAGSLVSIGLAWWVFGDHSLGANGMGERIAQKRAHDKAASSFILGSGLGSAFYSVFPPKPTLWEVMMATAAVGLVLTLSGLLIGVLNDPLLKRLGLHHRQLHALLDAIEDRLYLLRKRLKPTR